MENLAEQIAACGLSIRHVAEAIGVHRVTLSRAVNGGPCGADVIERAAFYVARVGAAESAALSDLGAQQ